MKPHPLSILKKLSVFLVLHTISISAMAQVYNSSVSSAAGGTGRAAVEVSDAIFLNPSSLVHLQGHFIYGSFAEKDLAVTLTDNSRESFLPSAIGFLQRKTDLAQGELVLQDISLALAEFVVDKWAFGITGHYLEQKFPTETFRKTNADIGLLYTPKSDVGWGLVGYNVLGEDTRVPEAYRLKTTVAGGFNYIYKAMARFRVDVSSDSRYMLGLENYLNRFFIVRIGYSEDTDDSRRLASGGLAFKGPRFAINYAYQGNLENSGDYRHSVDLEIPF